MNEERQEPGYLYKVRGHDGEPEWVDHDELWRRQRDQVEEVRREHGRRRRLLLLAMVGVVAVALVLVVLLLRSGGEAPSTAAEGPRSAPAGGSRVAADSPAAVAGPVVAVPAATAEPEPSTAEQVAGAVRTWAEAWASRDVPAYLASYARTFEPADGRTRSSWQDLRRRRLLTPEWIRVELEGVEITVLGEGRGEARFLQRYSSPIYSDVVRKRLDLVEEEGEWRIVGERVEAR